MHRSSVAIKAGITIPVWLLLLAGLYLLSLYSYLLFHGIVEVFGVIVACAIFVIAWNSRRLWEDSCFLLLGVGYLFVGGMDLVHTLAYKGMGVFGGSGADLGAQLWIAARYMESATLLTAPLFIGRKIRPHLAMLCYLAAFVALMMSIFAWPIFPVCFIEGQGLTAFKIGSEYAICVVLAASIYLLLRHQRRFSRRLLTLLICSVAVTVLSELSFTLYTDVYGLANLVGHFLKLVSFYLIYKAVVETGLARPYELLFRDLTLAKDRLKKALDEQEQRVRQRTADLDQAVRELQTEAIYRIKAEKALQASHHFLQIAYRHKCMGPLLKEFASEIKKLTGCQAVGIRMNDEQSRIPYKVYLGFPKEFHDSENFLSLERDQCMCINVIKGDVDASMPFCTEGGSVFVNGTSRFLATISEEQKAKTRNVCNQFGYESVALVPIKYGREILGLVHVADTRENRIPLETVEILERVAIHLGTAIRRVVAEKGLQQERQRLFGVLRVLPGYVALIGRDHSVRFANDRFVELFGQPADRPCYELIRGDRQPCPTCEALSILATEKAREWEKTDLTGRIFHVWGYPFEDADGTRLVLELGIDVTERKGLEAAVLRISEAEKRQIGRDLHDSLGQTLGGIACLSQVLHRELAAKSLDEAEQAAKIEALIADSVAMTRSLSRGLNPVGLHPDSLTGAVKELAANVESMFGVRCRFRCAQPVIVQDDIVAMHLYRIAQEAANNAVRHAEAKEIAIRLAATDGQISLTVTDDGIGLPEEAGAGNGMGLQIMKYRAESIGATMDIRRRRQGGTEVVCRLAQAPQRSCKNGQRD